MSEELKKDGVKDEKSKGKGDLIRNIILGIFFVGLISIFVIAMIKG
jgi:hypothetical protein